LTTSARHIELAMQAHDVISFDYPSSEDGRPVRRTLSPWQFERGGTILMGWDHDRERPRRYDLARIADGAEIEPNESFVHPN